MQSLRSNGDAFVPRLVARRLHNRSTVALEGHQKAVHARVLAFLLILHDIATIVAYLIEAQIYDDTDSSVAAAHASIATYLRYMP